MEQNHSGSGDNIHGNKVIFNSPKFFKRLILSIVSILLVLLIIAFALKENIRRMVIIGLLDDISYHTNNYQYYRSSTSYTQIQEKYNFINEIRGDFKFNADQNTILGNSLAMIGNYQEAVNYFKSAYQGYKKNNDLQNTALLLTGYCVCLVTIDSSYEKATNEFEKVVEQFSQKPNGEHIKWLKGNLALCKAMETSKDGKIEETIEYLEEYLQNFEPSSYFYVKSVEYNFNNLEIINEEFKELLVKLNDKYQREMQYYMNNN